MANTTADKLAKLNTTKEELKAALAEKGQTVGDVFSTYPDAVRAIKTGVETVSGIFLGGTANFYYFDGDSAQLVFGSRFESRDVAKGSIVFIRMSRELASFVCSGGNLLFELDTNDRDYGFIRVVEVTENNFLIGFDQ